MTIPSLVSFFHTKVKNTQIEVFEKKINQAMEQMQVRGFLLQKYNSTEEFVQKLSEVMKISAVCSSEKLSDCMGYDEVVTRKNKEPFSLDNAKEGKNAFHKTGAEDDYAETVGLILGNGVPVLLSYNRNCPLYDPETKYAVGETSSCIAAVFDINGDKAPNKFGDDVIGFNVARFGGSCSIESGSTCFTSTPFKPSPITKEECLLLKDDLGITYCNNDIDYWAGAVKMCGGKDKMPKIADMKNIMEDIYGASSSSYGNAFYANANLNAQVLKELNLNIPFYLWLAAETANPQGEYLYGGDIYFGLDHYQGQAYTLLRSSSSAYVMCVE